MTSSRAHARQLPSSVSRDVSGNALSQERKGARLRPRLPATLLGRKTSNQMTCPPGFPFPSRARVTRGHSPSQPRGELSARGPLSPLLPR
ncbi:hypothetical protein NDU88_001369 [Pleurodeles waltl]|uniref:Uncharacterized protein n=1 Tax=Pleurodeles waltl TaxID=8319 RepID=A0AAV7V810_PLEWA|nr:hypothetical protein NDU88_001369 [Pleurodeles waltl]